LNYLLVGSIKGIDDDPITGTWCRRFGCAARSTGHSIQNIEKSDRDTPGSLMTR